MEPLEPINEDTTIGPVVETTRPCRRCRNLFDPQLASCPFCGAVNRDVLETRPALALARSTADQALLTVCICYAVILAIDVLFGLAMSSLKDDLFEWYFVAVLWNDVIFVTATLVAWWTTRSLATTLDPTLPRAACWALTLPMLGCALGMNIAYHYVLHKIGDFAERESYEALLGSMTAAIIMICVEPALFEELFFRQVAWKSLRAHMGSHATILVTSVMFGMAHIAVPLSVPVLIGIGVVLGYLRLWSGGLALPMIVHFLHNLFVVLYPDM